MKPLIKFFKENKLITFLFVFSTVFFIYQHSLGIYWDFASYSLNAQYLFSDGNYFEWLRTPLPSFLIGLFTFFIFPYQIAEYFYILFVSLLFLFSCIKFAKSFGLDQTLFYTLILNPFLILTSFVAGAELLSFSFLLLFLSYLFSDKPLCRVKSGVSYALACLSRYNCFPYVILIFFSKNIKKNIIFIILFFIIIILTLSPWLFFNYNKTGHILTSIGNSHALNIKYRNYMFQQPSVLHFLMVGNLLIPFFIFGLKKFKFNRKNFIIVLVFIITLISYLTIPVKECRYLFNLILPLAYFSYLYIERIKNSKVIFSVLSVSTISFLLILSLFGFSIGYLNPPKKEFYEINISQNCSFASNQWVPLNYLGYPSAPPPREQKIDNYINEGYRIVIYYGLEPDYSTNMTFLRKFPVIKETKDYIILGNVSKCKYIHKFDSTYLERLNTITVNLYNYSIETNPCKSLGLGKICEYFKFL